MVRELLTGAAAGTAAAVPMVAYWEYMHRHLPGEPPRPLPPREIVEALAVKMGVSRQLSERDMQNLALLGHFGYGALTGALFGVMVPARPIAAVGCGLLFGVTVWTGSYLGWLPATGVRQSPRYDQPARTALMIGGHLVWGAITGLLAGITRPRRASTPGPARA
jgi:putative membrane protein